MRLPRILASLAAAAMFAVLATPGTADADTTPPATDLASIDASLLYPFETGLAAQYDATTAVAKLHAYEVCHVPVPPKTSCPPPLPATCGDAANVLNGTTSACFDLAAVDRSPHTGSTDWFIPFGSEAVGWSAATGGHAPANLTSADLRNIYTCVITQWNQITDIPGYTGPSTAIKIYVPPAGSSTRASFLSALGIAVTSAPCWQATTPAENEGTDPVFAGNPDAIFPYSLSHYVGQVYYGRGGGSDLPGALDALRSIDGVNQIDSATKSWNSNVPTAFVRSVYHVVRQADWADPVEGPRLKALLSRAVAGGYLCSAFQTGITSYGFHGIGASCGVLVAGI
ncbi:hypothetical protein GCM10009839_32360 [Catenulispora yoronensis]|uniref:PBP domain-containing protein n=1 Tax=Catenulispora yoronensis TaxID=450799 RepID=A0ABP5FR69_9ACTN